MQIQLDNPVIIHSEIKYEKREMIEQLILNKLFKKKINKKIKEECAKNFIQYTSHGKNKIAYN